MTQQDMFPAGEDLPLLTGGLVDLTEQQKEDARGVIRWAMSGLLSPEECQAAMIEILGEGNHEHVHDDADRP